MGWSPTPLTALELVLSPQGLGSSVSLDQGAFALVSVAFFSLGLILVPPPAPASAIAPSLHFSMGVTAASSHSWEVWKWEAFYLPQ